MASKLTWPVVGLIAVLGIVAFGMAAVAHWDAGAILGLLGILGGLGGGAAVTGAVTGGVADKLSDMHTVVEKIDHQTNGLSTQERQDIAERAVSAVLARQQPGS